MENQSTIVSGKTIHFPRDLAIKYGIDLIVAIAYLYYEIQEPSYKQWKKLKNLGLAEEYTLNEDEVIRLLKSKTPQIFPNSEKICTWCKATTCVLHAHHYPMRKSKGGQETINICPSCHCEFHFLVDSTKYRLTNEIIKIFDECYRLGEMEVQND
jgi:hypothetical protein